MYTTTFIHSLLLSKDTVYTFCRWLLEGKNISSVKLIDVHTFLLGMTVLVTCTWVFLDITERYTCPKETKHQDVFIYIMFCISMSRLDYIYINCKICIQLKQDLNMHIKICIYVSRFTYTNQDPLARTSSLINIDQVPHTRIDNILIHKKECMHI